MLGYPVNSFDGLASFGKKKFLKNFLWNLVISFFSTQMYSEGSSKYYRYFLGNFCNHDFQAPSTY